MIVVAHKGHQLLEMFDILMVSVCNLFLFCFQCKMY